MIFATVGTQLPFDRLLLGLDTWAANNPHLSILAQSGVSESQFSHIRTVSHMGQAAFQEHFEQARLIVGHAGMGTILCAAELGKPVILMPRRAEFGEHRNDHQQDTADEMSRLSNVTVAADQQALHRALDQAVASDFNVATASAADEADTLAPLIETIRDFVWAPERAEPQRRFLLRRKLA